MARLVVIAHEYDHFLRRKKHFWSKRTSSYLLHDVLRELEKLGHSWRLHRGGPPIDGDAAILHVDSTIVDPKYIALGAHYPRTINFGTGDISKRKISSLRLLPGDAWDGAVMVKANRNAKGGMEARHNRRAERKGHPHPNPGVRLTGPYRVLGSIGEVSTADWDDPDLIVERYLPERAGDHYVIRTWVFMGSRERCTYQLATDPIVKADKVIRYEACEVPEELRAMREKLNFDFGKFDFVMHDGKPILLDTNRTPGVSLAIEQLMKGGARNLAEGLDELVGS